LNGYVAVRQQSYIASGVLGPALDGVLPIDELLGTEIEVERSIEGSTGQSQSDVRARNGR